MEFEIPTSRDDLLRQSGADRYIVEEVLTLRQIPTALQGFKSACRGNAKCIVDHFDTLFSILCTHKDVESSIKEDAWYSLLKGCQTMSSKLANFLDELDMPREDRLYHLKSLKMACYLLCQFLEMFDGEMARSGSVITAKGKRGGKKTKSTVSSTDLEWDVERQQGLQILLSLLQLSLNKLWDPPIAEEEFVSLVSTCCYKLLENPSVVKNQETIITIGHIIGHLVKRYNHGLGASLKIDQMLKHFEFLTSSLVHLVNVMVTEHNCKSTVTEILREIGNTDPKEAARDTAAAKAYSTFLVELAEKMPAVVLPSISLVVCHLDGESYTLRNGVLGMMGEILVKYLSREELDDKLKATRDGFFDKLEDHLHDVNAFVRSKVIQIWLTIVTEQCLPIIRQESLMALVVGRLNDKSSNVRRNALQLVTALLKSNPFAAKLPVEDLRTNYEKEKAALDEMTPEPVTPMPSNPADEQMNQEWSVMEEKLEAALSSEAWTEREEEPSQLIGNEDSSENVLAKIVDFLEKEMFLDALFLTAAAMDSFPDLPVFSVFNRQEKTGEEDDSEDETEAEEPPSPAVSSAVMKEIYYWVKCPLPIQPADTSSSSAQNDKESTQLAKQQILVQYLKDSLAFAMQVQQCIPIICQLLGSKNTSDVLEAINFFVAAVEFGVSAAVVGVRRMMVLVWSQETSVKDAVVEAYRTLYLEPKEKNQRSVAAAVVKSLSSLVCGSTFGDLASLEAMVSQFVKSGHIGPSVIQALWEKFTAKTAGVTDQDRRAAVMLLSMCAEAQPEIVKSNIEVLVEEGLGTRAETDYLLAQGTCQALLKLTFAPKVKGKPPPEPFRLDPEHQLFSRLKEILVQGLTNATNPLWIMLADLAVSLIYKLAETPDVVCKDFLQRLMKRLQQEQEKEASEQASVGDGGDAMSALLSCVLARVLSVAGQVAFRQAVYMEVDILTEMKRRHMVSDDGKSGRRKSKGGNNDSSKASRNEAEAEEEMALAGASAEDTEAEYVRKICEDELLGDGNFLSVFHPLLVAVCTNSSKFPDQELQTAASLALARFMIVSSEFCESQLQLLFTLLQKSQSQVIRSNLIIALGDLTFRFPNLVEPWTSHLYARLRDESTAVRKTTLQVLTHLILNDMVKVKGQISELATCIVDPDERISGLAKLFFHELAKKGNTMYNMPDIISRLSDPDIGVEENDFHVIIKYIFSHIEKSKHCESLAEKLCHRFRATRTERQVRDLSFCLSQLTYTEKSLSKLLDNFACFADKLVDDDVYGHFCQIITKSRQFIRQETKTTLEELEAKLEQAHTKGLDQEEMTSRPTSTACVKGKKRGAKAKTPGRRGGRKNKENEDDENCSGEEAEIDPISPFKPRKSVRGREKPTKPRFTFNSDGEDDDDDLFDLGTEGQTERDLDADDSLVTKLSHKRSQKGKVVLTPLQSPAT